MPKGSKVDDIFQAIKRKGKDVASAAKIAQSISGEALMTGKPPKAKKKKAGKARLPGFKGLS